MEQASFRGSLNSHERSVVKSPSKTTIWLGLVFPGMGQAVQGRWLAAVAFGIPAVICLIGLFMTFFQMLVNGLRFLNDINEVNQPEFPIQRLIELVSAVIVIIIGSVIDASMAHSRACKQFNRVGRAESIVGPPKLR